MNMHRILWNFQLPPQLCSFLQFQWISSKEVSSIPHHQHPKQSEHIPKYCTVLFTGPQTRNGSLSHFSHPREQKLMELGSGCHKEMEKHGTAKGTAPAGMQGSPARGTAQGGTAHQCHWLSKSKNRTILRQVPKQGAIYFLGTISSYASRLLLYPLYCK